MSPARAVKCFKIPADVRQTAKIGLALDVERGAYRPTARAVFYT